MKKFIPLMLTAMLLSCMTACGAEEQSQVGQNQVDQSQAEQSSNSAETQSTSLTPREEFQKKKQEMEELLEEEETTTPTAVSYSTNGITYTFDSSLKPANGGADSAQHRYTSDTIWMTVEIFSNTFGYTTSQEIAEHFVDEDNGVVDSKNGVYFAEKDGTVRGCYVDDSGYYWMIYGFVTSQGDYTVERDRLIDFCTSGVID